MKNFNIFKIFGLAIIFLFLIAIVLIYSPAWINGVPFEVYQHWKEADSAEKCINTRKPDYEKTIYYEKVVFVVWYKGHNGKMYFNNMGERIGGLVDSGDDVLVWSESPLNINIADYDCKALGRPAEFF